MAIRHSGRQLDEPYTCQQIEREFWGQSHVLWFRNSSQLLVVIPICSVLALGRSSDRRVVLIAVPVGVRVGGHLGTARSRPFDALAGSLLVCRIINGPKRRGRPRCPRFQDFGSGREVSKTRLPFFVPSHRDEKIYETPSTVTRIDRWISVQ